jgi:hypothetical protein
MLPQFVSRQAGHVSAQILVLGLLFAAIAVVSDPVWALAAGALRTWFARSPRRLERVGAAGGVGTAAVGVGFSSPDARADLSNRYREGGLLMRSVSCSMNVSLDGYIVGRAATSTGRRPTRRSFASSPTRNDRSASTGWDGGCTRRCSTGSPPTRIRRLTTQCRVGRDLEAAPQGCSPPRRRRYRAMPAWPPAAWRRRSSGCGPSPGRATSRSAR